jgi:uncharacterized OsmC-like protein
MNRQTSAQKKANVINGIDTDAVKGLIGRVANDSEEGQTLWEVTTSWKGGARTQTHVDGFHIGGQYVKKDFNISTDEPLELGGTNQNANPQETLMAALNACMMVGYVVGCAMEGIELEELRIETKGEIDLRGFLGLDPDVKQGYDEIHYTVHIKGNGTEEQFRKVHETVTATSPNRYNVANPIRLTSDLVITH